MLRWRLPIGILLSVVLVVLCRLDLNGAPPGVWLAPIATAVTLLGTHELLALMALAGVRPLRWPVYVSNLLIVCSPWCVCIGMHLAHQVLGSDIDSSCAFHGWLPTAVSLCALGLATFFVFLCEMCRYEKPGGNLANIAGAVFALVYIGVMMSFAVSLRITWGTGALASWIIVVKAGDTGAYLTGRLIGRHKLVPRISQGKTIEGAFGDFFFCCLGSWAAFRWLVPLIVKDSVQPGPWWGWIVFGILVGTSGMIGDLAESILKRDVGRKDSSDWLPGLGGVLDILDSLLLSAPVAWFCWATGIVGR